MKAFLSKPAFSCCECLEIFWAVRSNAMVTSSSSKREGCDMRRLRYSVAATLDGFIADPDGGYDWIIMDEAIDFAAMFEEFDTFVMGRKTWDVSATDGVRGHVRR